LAGSFSALINMYRKQRNSCIKKLTNAGKQEIEEINNKMQGVGIFKFFRKLSVNRRMIHGCRAV
jgi:hypothetical protein